MGLLLLAFGLSLLALWLSLPTLFHGAVYLGMRQECILDMVKAGHVHAGMRMADFGSGDGRVVVAFARAGAEAHGYEIDPLLVLLSRWKIRRAGLANRATIHWQSFWSAYTADYDVITLYGFDTFMGRLERKLRAELRPGARVLSYVYQFPHWKPLKRVGRVAVYERETNEQAAHELRRLPLAEKSDRNSQPL